MRWNIVGRTRFSGSGGNGKCNFAIRFRWPHSGQRRISPGNLFQGARTAEMLPVPADPTRRVSHQLSGRILFEFKEIRTA
jgi:hypothetical protein